MIFKEYAIKAADTIISELGSSLSRGLSSEQAAEQLQKYGKNQQKEHDVSFWSILLRNMTSMFVILFFIINLFFIVLGEWSNAGIVFLLILINIGVGCYQEFKASKTIKLLKQYIEDTVTVLRDGKRQDVSATHIVPGDIIFLQAGDIVPADTRIVTAHGLIIDEASITGESAPIQKIEKALEGEVDLFKAFNIAFTGTLVAQGDATGVVIATADRTIFGSLVKKSQRAWQESTLEKAVVQLSKFIFLLSLFSLICVGIGNVMIKGIAGVNILELLVFATALMVCLVPEALPIVITFNLSLCVRRLLKMNIVVKRLSALEDFGAVEILCVDKTGTLTEQDLTLINTLAIGDFQELVQYVALTLLGQTVQYKSSFDGAIETFIAKDHADIMNRLGQEYEYVTSSPFDPERRRSGVLLKEQKTGQYCYILRGAYEIMENSAFPGSKDAHEWIQSEGLKGNRTLAIAIKMLNAVPEDLLQEEEDCRLVGIVSFSDPIKRTAAPALEQARNLGLSIKVISGDAPEVCGAVAHALQLIDDPSKVVTSKMFQEASLDEKKRLVNNGVVFSRVLPDQKAEIVQILKQDKRVGFMGDGLNDLPALMSADVALVVQGCPDVVREAGDIVLLNRSLLSVVRAIMEGRMVLANTMKYIKTTLAPSLGHFYALTIASLFIKHAPMLPIQILLLNFFSDFPLISLATDSVEPEELGHPKQYNLKNILVVTVILGIVSMIFDFICFSYFFKMQENLMQTGWFLVTVLTEIVFIFAIRSQKPFFKAIRPSIALGLCSLSVMIATLLLPYTKFGASLFHFAPLETQSLIFVCGLVLAYFISVELVKYMYYRVLTVRSHN